MNKLYQIMFRDPAEAEAMKKQLSEKRIPFVEFTAQLEASTGTGLFLQFIAEEIPPKSD